MWLQLYAALRRGWRSASSLQIGIGDTAAVLNGLNTGDHALLEAVAAGVSQREYFSLARRRGVTQARATELERALECSGVLMPADGRRVIPPGPSGPAQAALAYRCHSDDLVAARAKTEVSVIGSDGLSTSIAARLRDSGFNRARLEPDAPLRPDQLSIVVGSDLVEPLVARNLLRADGPHLAVVVTETGGIVGPLVVPGVTCCLRCVELYRRERQPWWPTVAAQLAGVRAVRAPVDPAVADAVASLAVFHAVTFLDGYRTPASYSALVTLSTADGTTSTTRLSPYRDCGCTWPGEVAAEARTAESA